MVGLLPQLKKLYMKGSADMLISKSSAGVAPNVKLRKQSHKAMKHVSWRVHPGFEIKDRSHQRSHTSNSIKLTNALRSFKGKKKLN